MPFFEDIGKKISNMGQTAVEKTKCSTETLRLNNQIREEQRLCKDLYQQIGQQYAQQYETNPDPAFESLMKQLHDAQERITSYQEQIQIKKDGGLTYVKSKRFIFRNFGWRGSGCCF